MSLARRTVEEYTALLARAFNGAIEVDGQRIVAHPSGTLLARSSRGTQSPPTRTPSFGGPCNVAEGRHGELIIWQTPVVVDRENDWSDI